jgi:DNA-binding SARP family transcriptional activator
MPRDRLNRMLDGVWGGRVGLVVGPAGAGKTTCVAQFAEASSVPTAWYRADAADSRAPALLAGLERSVSAAFGFEAGGWDTPEAAAADLEAWAGPRGLVVVDDLHVLFGTAAEAALGRLLDYLPPTISVLVTSRRLPSFDVSRLRVSGLLVEVSADDLRFRSWEVETLFREFYGEPLPPEDTAELARRTGGWSAGLTLFHLATEGKPAVERRRLVATLAANSRLVREYLTRHLMEELPPDLRRFLVETSVLGSLTGPLCDALLGASHSERTLQELERRQLFTSEVDEAGTYRYHQVLRVHLENVLVQDYGEDGATARYRRAAALLEEAGAHADAVRAHCRASDWAAAARLLGYQGEQLAAAPGAWIDAVPATLLGSSPWLMLVRARRYLAAGRLTDAFGAYREAEAASGSSGPAALCRSERMGLREWTEPGTAAGAAWVRLARAATRRDPLAVMEQAARLPGPTGRLAEAVAAALAGETERATVLYRSLADDDEAGDVLVMAARLGAALMAPYLEDGGTTVAAELVALADDAERGGVPALAELARVAAGARGDIGTPVLPQARPGADGWVRAFAALDAGWALLRRGAPAVEVLEAAAAAFASLDAPVCEAWARAALASARAEEGDREAAAQAAAEAAELARRAVVPGVLALGEASPAEPAVTGPAVQVRCLGPFVLIVDGREVNLAGVKPRARALLRLLALHRGGAVHRETLADALWPEADLAAAIRSLQVAVSSLRGVLEPGSARGAARVLVREGDSYRLALSGAGGSDVAAFEAAQAEARRILATGDGPGAREALARARLAYGGDLLPEDGPAEWVVKARDQLRLQAAEVAQTEATLALDAGDPASAVAVCTWALALDRYQDALWRLLIRAHETAGDAAAACRAGREYERILDELGLSRPGGETEALTG